MLKFSGIRRAFGTSSRIFREEGGGGLYMAVREWVGFRKRYVKLDGCTFDLSSISNPWLKTLLVRKEYEGFERRAVRQHIRREFPVVELGGCLGVVACITNRALKDKTPHVVVEANPQVIPLIEGNRARNRCDFEILNAAIAYGESTVTFCPSFDLPSTSLRQASGADLVTVNTISLKEIVGQRKIGTFTLICDIEGHEYDLVQHESDVLKNADTIILETHARMIGEAKNTELLGRLKDIGFVKIDEEATVVVLKRLA